MSSSSINNLSSGYLQSILSSALQNAGLTTNKTGNSDSLSGIDPSSVAQSDHSQLSPFAQLMSTLQQLQQSDPTKYQQVTQQIATNLQSAAQTAQSDGNTTAASQLSQLATDFTNASTSDQLPNIQDLAQAIGTHHHHHAHPASADSDTSSSTSSTSSSSASQVLSQLLSSFQANGAQSDALNPMSIILNTLSNAGISSSNG
jgi:ribosomal protein L22